MEDKNIWCPFCDHKDAILQTRDMFGRGGLPARHQVRCMRCSASGPFLKDKEDAIFRWENGKYFTRLSQL